MQYARSYYRKRSKLHGSYFQPGGWDFPGDDEPHYKDFLYFSFEIRMTFRRCRCAYRFSFDEIQHSRML
jgi:uncharacterized membrane protein